MCLFECRSFADKDMHTVDAEMIQDADRFQMNLVGGLERTLHGKIKPSMCDVLRRSAAAGSPD